MWSLVLALLGSVGLGMWGMADARLPLVVMGGLTTLSSLVLLWLLETRFWTYWAKYADRRFVLLGVCYVPLAVVAVTAAFGAVTS